MISTLFGRNHMQQAKNVHWYPYVFRAYSFSSGLKNDKQILGELTSIQANFHREIDFCAKRPVTAPTS